VKRAQSLVRWAWQENCSSIGVGMSSRVWARLLLVAVVGAVPGSCLLNPQPEPPQKLSDAEDAGASGTGGGAGSFGTGGGGALTGSGGTGGSGGGSGAGTGGSSIVVDSGGDAAGEEGDAEGGDAEPGDGDPGDALNEGPVGD
jgi:hypothetical protein